MPVFIGDENIDVLLDYLGDDYDSVYIGSDKVWPDITFPYTLVNTNVTGAAIPAGATGAWVHLWGKGTNGGAGQHDDGTPSNGSAPGGSGGGGGGHVDRIFIYVEDMGADWSLFYGTAPGAPNRFVSGGIDLIANCANGTNGGTASANGLTASYYSPRASNGGNRGQNSDGAGAGGADGGDSSWTGDNAPNTTPPGTRGLGTNGGTNGGTGGTAYGSGNAHHYASGGGGGGGGGYVAGNPGGAGTQNNGGSGGIGGPARAKVVWTNEIVPKVKDWTYTPGSWSWTCPTWMPVGSKVDLIMYGGGKAGATGAASGSQSGAAGAIDSVTLTVGTDINPGDTLSGTVGAGGASAGANGGNTTCTQLGRTAAGGTTTVGTGDGGSPGNRTQGTLSVTGGTGGAHGSGNAGSPGTDPGAGGGGGGFLFIGFAGGAGGGGRVYVRAREV